MFPGTRITFVSASASLLEAAKAEGLDTVNPATMPVPASDVDGAAVPAELRNTPETME